MTTEAGQNRLDAEAPSKGRLLIVDDSRDFAAALRNLLALEGYEVETAHDGDAARAALKRFDAEVLLLDLRLESGSGFDLIAPLKERYPGLVFVIMTGYAETGAAVEALRRGAYDFLRKPIDEAEILAALERAFERIRLEEAKLAAEREIAGKSVLLETMLESMSQGITAYDADHRLIVFNRKFVELFDYPPEFVRLGMSIEDLARFLSERGYYGPGDVEELVRQRVEALELGEINPRERTRPDGTVILARRDPMPGGGVVTIYTDITEAKLAEEQLRQAQKMEAVGQLTGGIAHDFNNLLAIVMGNLELLEDALVANEPRHEFLSTALSATVAAGTLTQQLLAFARKQPLAPRAADTNALVGKFIGFVRRTLDETIAIKTSFAAGLAPVFVDPVQLESALLNLVVNARDAVGRSGEISIKTAGVRIGAADTETDHDLDPGDYVTLAVSDTGAGIAPELLDHVFDPFFTTKDIGAGSGLGLSMVYGFAKQSDGHVTIDSEVGRGTTVTIYLPTAAGAVDGDAQPAAAPAFAGAGETILVVEDEEAVRYLLVTLLSGMGYKVHEAGDGKSALAIMHEAPDIDLLLTDVLLPGGMDGVELAHEAQRRRPHLPVLYASGYSATALEHQGRLDGNAELIEKPFRQRDLAAKIATLLESDV